MTPALTPSSAPILDLIPAAGYSDDLGALVLALAAVAVHVKDIHKEKAKEMLLRWFPKTESRK